MKWRSSDWVGHKDKRKGKKHSSSLPGGTKALSVLQGGGCVFTAMQRRVPPSLGCILSEAQTHHLLHVPKSNLLRFGNHLLSPSVGDSMGSWTFSLREDSEATQNHLWQ